MKYLKKFNKFNEDDCYVNASTAGMGDVVNSQPGEFSGQVGTEGSGDVFSYFKKKKRKKGNPSSVSDLRDLKEVDTNEIKEDLNSDFESRIEEIKKDNLNIGHSILSFLEKIPKKLQPEFKYRLGDGEGVSELIEDFLQRHLLKNDKNANFIGNLIIQNLKDTLTEDDYMIISSVNDLITHYDKKKSDFIKEISDLDDFDEIEDCLVFAKKYFEDLDEDFKKLYGSDKCPNKFRLKTIDSIMELIDELKRNRII